MIIPTFPNRFLKKLLCFCTSALVFAGLALHTHAGALLFNYYGTGYPAGGNALTNLTLADPNFPAFPDFAYATTTGLQDSPTQTGSFGTWARGFLEAPKPAPTRSGSPATTTVSFPSARMPPKQPRPGLH